MKHIIYYFAILVVFSIVACNNPTDSTLKNDLLPDKLRMVYKIDLADSLQAENNKDIGDIKFIDKIFERVMSEKVKVYEPIDKGDYYPYSVFESDLIAVAQIKERMDAVDRTAVIEEVVSGTVVEKNIKGELFIEEIKSVLFIEDWLFNDKSFVFEKDVVGIVPVRTYYRDDDTLHLNPKMKKVFRLFPTKDMTSTQLATAEKKLQLIEQVEYEYLFNQSEFLLQSVDSACYACLKNNGEQLEDYFAPYFNSITRMKLINMLLNKAIKGEIKVYDAWERDKVIPANEIMPRMGAVKETIMVQNSKTGELEEQESEPVMDKRQIKSVIFIEDWLLDPETLYMKKVVRGIVPVRHYYKEDDVDYEFPIKKKVFLIKFGNQNSNS